MDLLQHLYRSPECLGLNRLTTRATLYPFDDSETARQVRKGASPYVVDLNGEWAFYYTVNPAEIDDAMVAPECDDSAWDRATVPHSFVMHGYDKPHYTNVNMPFPELPPEIPQENPTGIYRRTFEVDAAWGTRRQILHFDGADSCFFAWLNGEFVGMSKDSRGITEFDVTEIVRCGETNQLTVAVLKWSDATFLEDQDQWYMPGLSRSVYLYSTAPDFIGDVQAGATLDADLSTGVLELELHAGFASRGEVSYHVHQGYHEAPVGDWYFRVRLFDPAGNPVWEEPKKVGYFRGSEYWLPTADRRRQMAKCRVEIPEVRAWSAETPDLYTLTVELVVGEAETVSEATGVKVGFRRLELKNRELRINGAPVLICGANRHDHHDTLGKAVPYETMKRDVELMKRFNFNAVRTSHYPNAPEFYDLCDEYGLYVICEANLETHAFYNDLTNDPRWAGGFLDRAVRMFECNKNHASIYAWSLGNESGCGANHAAMAGYLRYRDKTRLLHYEGAVSGNIQKDNYHLELTDFICPMYTSIDGIIAWAERGLDPRPLILCEYSHAMGNSNGSLKDYFAAFRKYHGLQGGFIWEWIDHGILQTDAKGRKFWAYGGDFGDVPNDANFCTDGLIWPDRTVHPAVYEFQYLAQPVEWKLVDAAAGRIQLFNRQYFRDLAADYEVTWSLQVDGRPVKSGRVALPAVAPRKTAEIAIPCERVATAAGEVLTLRVELVYRHDTRFAQAGEAAGWEVFELPVLDVLPRAVVTEEVTVEPRADEVTFRSGSTVAKVTAAGLVSLVRDGKELLEQGPRLDIWRAATDNDGIKILLEGATHKALWRWIDKGYDQVRRRSDQFTYDAATGTATLHQMIESPKLESNLEFTQAFRMLPGGELLIDNTFVVPQEWTDLPRLGLTMELPGPCGEVEYFGNGPFENYIDRDAGAKLGRYRTTADAMYVPYIMPQSCGNRTGVREAVLTAADGQGVAIAAPGTMEFAAMRYSEDQLYAAFHTNELEARDRIYVRMDLRERGVGTATCGPDTLPEYQIMPGRYRFAITLKAAK